jgi:hypothetical protein
MSNTTTDPTPPTDPTEPDPTPSPSPDPSPPAPASPPPPPPPLFAPPVPPPTQAPDASVTKAQMDDLAAQVAATTSIEDSTVTLLEGVAAQFAAAAPGNAAVAALAAKLHASAERLGKAITDCTPYAAPALSPQQIQMGAVKAKR